MTTDKNSAAACQEISDDLGKNYWAIITAQCVETSLAIPPTYGVERANTPPYKDFGAISLHSETWSNSALNETS
jgi:hypothetical protein